MHLEMWQWLLGAAAGWLIGMSKTGIPGVAMLVVPLLAVVFGGRISIGMMLPMLIFGDLFAITWYRRHVLWDTLLGLMPWAVTGMGSGAFALWMIGKSEGSKDILSLAIGTLVLMMLAIHLLEKRLGDRLDLQSHAAVAVSGTMAGFAAVVSNVAGPITYIYLTANKLNKQQFMGTIAWYFFILNLIEMPIYFTLSAINPHKPVITGQSLLFVAIISPAILAGVFLGRWLLPRLSQRVFTAVVLFLSAAAAVFLIVAQVWKSLL